MTGFSLSSAKADSEPTTDSLDAALKGSSTRSFATEADTDLVLIFGFVRSPSKRSKLAIRSARTSPISGFSGTGSGAVFGSSLLICSRRSATCSDNSSVRAGASPRQNGTVGAAPCASSTSTRPELDSTRRMRHEVLPSSMMSPALLSTAKSSSSVPTTMFSGCASTVNSELSGMAPPLVMAANRAPRRARRRRFTMSRKM